MAFWIIGVFGVLGIIAAFFKLSDLFGFIGVTFVGLLSSLFIVMSCALTLGTIMAVFPTTVASTQQNTYQLRVLDSGSGTEGRGYFLGGGYVDSERVLNYIIRHEDGHNEVSMVDADKSRIWEDTKTNPYVVVTAEQRGNPWVAPFNYSTTHSYDFHVPNGSVVESTKITNK